MIENSFDVSRPTPREFISNGGGNRSPARTLPCSNPFFATFGARLAKGFNCLVRLD
jgi:hypothetical protein